MLGLRFGAVGLEVWDFKLQIRGARLEGLRLQASGLLG